MPCNVDPNTDGDSEDDEVKNMLIGLECSPVKGFAASLNYRTETFIMGEDIDDYIEKYFYLSTVFSF